MLEYRGKGLSGINIFAVRQLCQSGIRIPAFRVTVVLLVTD
jgi:hypothetical protein